MPGEQAQVARIAEAFEFVGATPEADYRRNLRLLLQLAPRGTQVFILLAQEARPGRDGVVSVQPRNRTFNEWTRHVAGDFTNVTTLPMEEFLTSQDDLLEGTHYDRMVYYRIYERIMRAWRLWRLEQASTSFLERTRKLLLPLRALAGQNRDNPASFSRKRSAFAPLPAAR